MTSKSICPWRIYRDLVHCENNWSPITGTQKMFKSKFRITVQDNRSGCERESSHSFGDHSCCYRSMLNFMVDDEEIRISFRSMLFLVQPMGIWVFGRRHSHHLFPLKNNNPATNGKSVGLGLQQPLLNYGLPVMQIYSRTDHPPPDELMAKPEFRAQISKQFRTDSLGGLAWMEMEFKLDRRNLHAIKS